MDIPTEARRILADHFGVLTENVGDTVRLADNLGADGLDMVEIAMRLDEAFHVEITEEDAGKMITVADMISYLGQRVPA